MGQWYSDLISGNGESVITLPTTPKINPAGRAHGRVRYKRAHFVGLPLDVVPDQVRLATFKSSDRILELFQTMDGLPSAGNQDLGFYESGVNHDGPIINNGDEFLDAFVVTGAVARVDKFDGNDFADEDRGKTIWELLVVAGQTYTEDPLLNIDLVLTIDTSYTVLVNTEDYEMFYTAGD